jgi:hypothetical protein
MTAPGPKPEPLFIARTSDPTECRHRPPGTHLAECAQQERPPAMYHFALSTMTHRSRLNNTQSAGRIFVPPPRAVTAFTLHRKLPLVAVEEKRPSAPLVRLSSNPWRNRRME